MQRIAAPMIGGMITAPLLSMFVIPAAYLLMRRPRGESPGMQSTFFNRAVLKGEAK
jgi:Cu(I)/Ag(I) efflux system membrane protein CusA/SilA